VESVGTGSRLSDKVQGKATVSTGGVLSLTAGGNITVAGGDGAKTLVSAGFTPSSGRARFVDDVRGLASADASTTLSAGGNMTLNATGNLLIRGGSDADALAKAFGGSDTYTAVTTANTNIKAGGNLTITAGGGATFQGGSNASGQAWALGGFNKATATGQADLNLTVGGNLTVSVTGPLNVFGGPLVEGVQSASIAAVAAGFGNQAVATATARVNLTAGGNVSIAATGGNLSIAGASSAASFRTVQAGSSSSNNFDNNAKVSADGSVNIKGKNVTLTATGGGVFVGAGRQSASRSVIAAAGSVSSSSIPAHGGGNKASLTVNSSVNVTATGAITVSGTAVTFSGAPSNSHTHITVGSFSSSATVKQISNVHFSAPTIHITPPQGGSSFGNFSSSGYQFSGGVTLSNLGAGGAGAHLIKVSGPSSAVHSAPTAFVVPVTHVDLGTVQGLSLVTHLVTMLGDDSIALVPMTQGFSVSVDRKESLLTLRTTDFTPAGSGAGGR
jgi:hypothetical protein